MKIEPSKLMFWNDFLVDDIPICHTPSEYIDCFGELDDTDFFMLEKSWEYLIKSNDDVIQLIDKFGNEWVTILLSRYEHVENFEQCIILRNALLTYETHY